MAKIFIEESTLSAIGDSIRAKTGKTGMIPTPNMPTEIASIQTADNICMDERWKLTREELDEFAVASQTKAVAAQKRWIHAHKFLAKCNYLLESGFFLFCINRMGSICQSIVLEGCRKAQDAFF